MDSTNEQINLKRLPTRKEKLLEELAIDLTELNDTVISFNTKIIALNLKFQEYAKMAETVDNCG